MCKPRSPPRQGQPPVYAGTQTTLVPLRIKLIDNLPIHLESKKLTDIVKNYFFKGLFMGRLEIQKMNVNLFCMVSVLPQTFFSPYQESPRAALFYSYKKCFHIFLFCQIISSQIPIIKELWPKLSSTAFPFFFVWHFQTCFFKL